MTREERLAKLNSLEAQLTVGKRYVLKFPQARLALTHPSAPLYHLNASWSVPETYDDDPQSRLCDCDLQGMSHAHARQDYATYDETASAFADIEQQIIQRQPVTLPLQWMPRWHA